jgi:hypothetical protein
MKEVEASSERSAPGKRHILRQEWEWALTSYDTVRAARAVSSESTWADRVVVWPCDPRSVVLNAVCPPAGCTPAVASTSSRRQAPVGLRNAPEA